MAKNSDRKEAIRESYRGQMPWKEEDVDIFPVTVEIPTFDSGKHMRVCAYARVSTDSENQTTSLALQQATYRKMIEEHENWEYVDLYYDEGITGTSIKHRDGFKRMLEDCRAGKIDAIITKSTSRFARNLVDSIATQQELSRLNPPVGVYFETEHIYSLDPKTKMQLANMAVYAEWESQNKSEIMNWSIDKRYEFGHFLVPCIFGYDKDEEGNLVINEREAPLVRLFYYLFLQGFSVEALAEIANGLGYISPSKKEKWSKESILGMLQNEKYCGELRARKTYTPDYLTHLARKNKGNKKRYYVRNHHPAIVSPEIYKATLQLIALHKYTGSGYTLPDLCVVKKGALRGYIPVDRNWDGYTYEEYKEACLAGKNPQEAIFETSACEEKNLWRDLSGCTKVGSQLFSSKEDLYMTISNGLVAFNLPCVEALNTDSVCLYWNPIEMRMAVLSAQQRGRNFKWAYKDERWKVRPKSIAGFDRILYPILSWNEKYRYRMKGKLIEREKEKALIFDLNCYETCIDNRVFYPQMWKEDFGSKFGKIQESDFPQKKFIESYQDCEEIASALPKDEFTKLEEKVRNLMHG